jgi:hypothetical protein
LKEKPPEARDREDSPIDRTTPKARKSPTILGVDDGYMICERHCEDERLSCDKPTLLHRDFDFNP